jgi:hypothetical protein
MEAIEMVEYKVVALRIPAFKSKETGAEKIQEEMNKQAKNGWRVHKVNITDLTMVIITFEKET